MPGNAQYIARRRAMEDMLVGKPVLAGVFQTADDYNA